uniref:Protein-lysine N-trimethyltransferase SMYD5 n=1 Tax=Timema californicum TaxID=61474 RepID=A0A7R9J6D0_TIMCA|nr:unnamed protein product [Timema californicum]
MMETQGYEVRFINESKGKGLFATQCFNAGDIIFEERPLVCCQFSWNGAYRYAACDFCMRPLESTEENARRLTGKKDLVLPYPECCPTDKKSHIQCKQCSVRYCCADCRDAAWSQYHKTLCTQSRTRDPSHPLEQLNDTWKQMHYPPETATIMLVARMIANVRQAEDQEGAFRLFMQFCHKTKNEEEEFVHKLLGKPFSDQLQMLREQINHALYADCVQQWLTQEGFLSLVALVGTNGQGVGTSPISEWVKNASALELPEEEKKKLDKFIENLYDELSKEAGTFLNSEGTALYSLQSACNHSCDANAEVAFPYSNFQLVMRATKDINPGDEICVSYVSECVLDRSRHTRHKILSSARERERESLKDLEKDRPRLRSSIFWGIKMKGEKVACQGQLFMSINLPVVDVVDKLKAQYTVARVCYSQHYLFACRCTKCESQVEDPDVTSEEESDESSEEEKEFEID